MKWAKKNQMKFSVFMLLLIIAFLTSFSFAAEEDEGKEDIISVNRKSFDKMEAELLELRAILSKTPKIGMELKTTISSENTNPSPNPDRQEYKRWDPEEYEETFAKTLRTSCPEGSETVNGGDICWCKINYFGHGGVAPCQPCDTGSITTKIGDDICSCTTDYYSVDGMSPCNNCPLNTFADAIESKSCSCEEGFYSDSSNSGTMPCYSCPANTSTWRIIYYGPSTYLEADSRSEETSCTCDSGYFSANGEAPCQLCPKGSNTWLFHYYHTCPPNPDGSSNDYDINPGASDYYKRVCRGNDYGDGIKWTYMPRGNGGGSDWYWDDLKAQTNCMCDEGYVSSNGRPPCTECPSGTTTGAAYYKDGKEVTERGDQTCSRCAIGFISDDGSPPCTECPVGTTTLNGGAYYCDLCAMGYYHPIDGTPPCNQCPEGFTTLGVGSTECVNASTVSNLPTMAPIVSPYPTSPTDTPTRAPVRTHYPTKLPTMQPSHYDDCWIGHYSATGKNSAEQPICDECPSGSTNDAYGMPVCDKCVEGYYRDTASTNTISQCVQCPPDYYSNYDASFCYSCFGSAPCSNETTIPCPKGTFRYPGEERTTDLSTCQQCQAGSIAGAGSNTCTYCPSV